MGANPANTTSGFKPLPMTDASDSWMDEDVGEGFSMEDEDDEEEKKTAEVEERKTEPAPANPPNISTGFKPLPMTEASDSWMDDDVGVGFTMEDEDEEDRSSEPPKEDEKP